MTRLQRSRVPLAAWGVIGIVALALLAYLIFGGRFGLGGDTSELKAVFRSEAQLGIRSPVRIAGVDVGKVTKIEPMGDGSGAAVVTMRLDPDAPTVHRDAGAKIRSRLLLEGNFFVDLNPGSPSSPAMPDGGTIGVDRTSGPVQLDRILSDLNTDTRMSLRTVLQGLGRALGGEPTETATEEDESTEGETAGQSANDALEYLPGALLGTAITTEALLGLDENDLSKLVDSQGRVLGSLANRERQLADLLTNLNTTMSATASQQANLGRSVALLPGVLTQASRTFDTLNASFPPTRAIARELRPGIRELPSTVDAALPWIEQNRLLLQPSELGGLAASARPAVADLASTLNDFRSTVLPELNLIDRCLVENVLPTSETVIQDPPLTTGVPVYLEAFQTFVGVASAAQNFDGNGNYLRAQSGGGAFPITTSELREQGPLRGNATNQPLGTRPAFPGKAPPYNRAVACAANDRPDLNSAKTGGGP